MDQVIIMKFIYYSNEPLDFIKSVRKKGDVTQSDILTANKRATLTDAVGSAIDAIQFFVYPQGKDKLYNAVFLDTTKPLYENKVDIEQFPINVVWELRDTREYSVERSRLGDKDDVKIETHMNNWMAKNGHSGRGRDSLLKAVKKYTTNFLGKPNAKLQPVISIYPYVGYVRVSESQMKTFSSN